MPSCVFFFGTRATLSQFFFLIIPIVCFFFNFTNTFSHISFNTIFHFSVNLFTVNCIILSKCVTHYKEIPENSDRIHQDQNPRTIEKNLHKCKRKCNLVSKPDME